MTEELENSVREMLKAETFTRAGISSFTKDSLVKLADILKQARAEDSEEEIKTICDEQLANSRDSLIALYLSGMIALHSGSLDDSALINLVEIFNKNHKEQLTEYLCNTILKEYPTNLFAMRRLANYYKETNDERVWELYDRIVKADLEEADIAKALADHYLQQQNKELAISFYKKALLRYIAAKNSASAKTVWTELLNQNLNLLPEQLDFFLMVQRKIEKSINSDKAVQLLQDVYKFYKNTSNWDTAISLLKLILSMDRHNETARDEIVECYRGKYKDTKRIDEYIKMSSISLSSRDVFEAIIDLEKHIAFAPKEFVFHKAWGVGIITKVEKNEIFINFGAKAGKHKLSMKMAVETLQPLNKDHIWVKKATTNRADLAKAIDENPSLWLMLIIKSFPDGCDEKKIKAELVPAVFPYDKVSEDSTSKTSRTWNNWHNKAKKILESDPRFGVSPDDVTKYIVRDKEMDAAERLSNKFKAEKDFFARIDILEQFLLSKDIEDKSSELFFDMYNYFSSFVRSAASTELQRMASFLVVKKIQKSMPSLNRQDLPTFAELYSNISNPCDMYENLKDSKVTTLKQDFLENIKLLSQGDDEYVKIFPTALKKEILDALIMADKTDKVKKLVRDSFDDYRNYRDAAIYFFKNCRNEEWFKDAGISYEKQLSTLINIISYCFREISNHVNTTNNKKTIKNACEQLFDDKTNGGKNNLLDYMLKQGEETTARMFTMVNDVSELEAKYKTQLRKGILDTYPDFKFAQAEVKQERSRGLLVTARKLEEVKAEIKYIESVELPEIAQHIAEAREKGDLSENADYSAYKEAQKQKNQRLKELNNDLARAEIFDPTTVSTSLVSFGTKITVHNNTENRDEVYTILGPFESNIEAGIISYMSPMGNNFLNAKVGQNLKFVINEHQHDFTVNKIEIASF